MLVAALNTSGVGRAQEVIHRATKKGESAKRTVVRGCAVAAAWEDAGPILVSEQAGFVLDGAWAGGSADVSLGTLDTLGGAFAMIAPREDGILLASGHAGGYRPLYVAWPSKEAVVASSHLATLLQVLPERPGLDAGHIAGALLMSGIPSTESTPYAGVYRIPHGESWLVRPGVEPRRRSTIRPFKDSALRDDNQLPRLLREALTDAVRRAVRDRSRVGIEVSGGLDSSFLLALLVGLARSGEIPSNPEAIAFDFEAPSWQDDRPHLRALEVHLGVRAHRLTAKDAAACFKGPLVIDGVPAPSPLVPAAIALGRVARDHAVDVVLTGQGGDEALDGNPRLFGELARKGEIVPALRGALGTRGPMWGGMVDRLDHYLLRPFLASTLPRGAVANLRRRRRRAPSWAGPALVRRVGAQRLPAPPPVLDESPAERYERLLRSSVVELSNLMSRHEELAGGFCIRSPFLDDEFLRFAARIPPLALMRGGYLRGLMREAMRGLVPEAVRLRVTKGSWFWFVDRMLEEAGGLKVLSPLANVRMLADLGLVEPKAFRKLFDEFVKSPPDGSTYSELWHVLSAEAFLREFAGSDRAARAA